MRRFALLLANEFRLFRTALPFHLVAIVQPSILFLLFAIIMVEPTFDMKVVAAGDDQTGALLAAMDQVGSPAGVHYINAIPVNAGDDGDLQTITVEAKNNRPVAVQRFGYIDSNIVKNLRNRLTAALLIIWNNDLGSRAVVVNERPWLPVDVPFSVYFGMALLPMTASFAASVLGGILTAQDFEFQTIMEFRLSPTSPLLILAARIIRLVLLGLVASALLLLAIGLTTGYWPSSVWVAFTALLPAAVIAGCFGVTVGLLVQQSLPAFLLSFAVIFLNWILGSAFGLAAGFSGAYETVSRFLPNTYIVEILFPHWFFDQQVGNPLNNALVLLLMCLIMFGFVWVTYRYRVLKPG